MHSDSQHQQNPQQKNVNYIQIIYPMHEQSVNNISLKKGRYNITHCAGHVSANTRLHQLPQCNKRDCQPIQSGGWPYPYGWQKHLKLSISSCSCPSHAFFNSIAISDCDCHVLPYTHACVQQEKLSRYRSCKPNDNVSNVLHLQTLYLYLLAEVKHCCSRFYNALLQQKIEHIHTIIQ